MTYEFVVKLVRLLLRRFFRDVEVTGLEHVPSGRGGLVVSWHPNGIIDPALILSHFPGQIVFGARHGLFKVPVMGSLMRAIGTIPIYRAQDAEGGDEEARRGRNRASLDALAQAVADGRFSALFPEGVSHDDPHFHDMKVGAARLYYRAVQLTPAGSPPPVIVPVGLHYDDKASFRSKALVAFHPPLELSEELRAVSEDAPKVLFHERCSALTEALEGALVRTVHPTESWEEHRLMHRVAKLFRAERGKRFGAHPSDPDMRERAVAFHRVWEGYRLRRQSDPAETAALMARVREYDADLTGLDLEDVELDQSPKQGNLVRAAGLILQLTGLYVLAPPLLVLGLVVNGPPYYLVDWLAQRKAKLVKDLASLKWLFGIVAYPITWAATGALVWFGWVNLHEQYPKYITSSAVTATLLTLVFSFVGGLLALRYTERVRETLRAIRVRLTRARSRKAIERLKQERGELFEALSAMAVGLELPGKVAPDGRIL